MLEAFNKHITDRFPFLKNSQVLLACSGGVDSTVLADLLYASKIKFGLAHCNFGLRGEESDSDHWHVGRMAKEYDVPFFSKRFELQEKQGSVQLLARNRRYDWFKEVLGQQGYDYLLTAHHADDSLETFLINLSRGTGIEGLTGIPGQNDNVVRPLLPFSRKDILAYAKQEKLAWREDSSNSETKYLRNKIRLDIIPKIKDLHPTALQNFQKTINHLEQTQKWIENQIKLLEQKVFINEDNIFKISINELSKITPIETTLFLLFKEFGFTNIKDLESLLNAESGKELRSKTHRLVKNREYLLLSNYDDIVSETFVIYEGVVEIVHPLQMNIHIVEVMDVQSKNTIYVDKETLNYPLRIRKWENGDYFYPFGMKGRKKVSKFFKDEKIDILSKEKQWLLCSGDKIVWIIGRRADDRFKVTKNTKHIVKLSCID